MPDEEWQASLDRLAELGPPPDLGLGWDDGPENGGDPDDGPPPGSENLLTGEIIAECREASAQQADATARAAKLGTAGALGAIAASLGRRGPGMPGSAQAFPGEYPGPAGAFATGLAADIAPGCAVLAQLADRAAGDGDRYPGVSDDELTGVICAWDRVQAHAGARKLAAMAELLRRRPAPAACRRAPRRCRRSRTSSAPMSWSRRWASRTVLWKAC